MELNDNDMNRTEIKENNTNNKNNSLSENSKENASPIKKSPTPSNNESPNHIHQNDLDMENEKNNKVKSVSNEEVISQFHQSNNNAENNEINEENNQFNNDNENERNDNNDDNEIEIENEDYDENMNNNTNNNDNYNEQLNMSNINYNNYLQNLNYNNMNLIKNNPDLQNFHNLNNLSGVNPQQLEAILKNQMMNNDYLQLQHYQNQGMDFSMKENMGFNGFHYDPLVNMFHNHNYMQETAPYLYTSTGKTYALDFQLSETSDRLALGTLDFGLENKIEILSIQNDKLTLDCSCPHQFPITKLQWCPFYNINEVFGATSDILRMYRFNESDKTVELKAELWNKKSQYSDPLTSFDWNKVNETIVGTASLDSTCTIWDVHKEVIKTQLIAHDSEVLDIAFSYHDENIFITAGADGSIRQFDLRCLEHSTILYECRQKEPFTKVSWNSINQDQFSAISDKKDSIYVISIPITDKKKKELTAHSSTVNSFAWAPNSQSVLCTVGEDGYAYIWDMESDNGIMGPELQYNAQKPIKNVSWSKANKKWIGIVYDNNLKLLNL